MNSHHYAYKQRYKCHIHWNLRGDIASTMLANLLCLNHQRSSNPISGTLCFTSENPYNVYQPKQARG